MKLLFLWILFSGAALVSATTMPADSGRQPAAQFNPSAGANMASDSIHSFATPPDECCRESVEADASERVAEIGNAPEPAPAVIICAGLLVLLAIRQGRGSQRRIPRS